MGSLRRGRVATARRCASLLVALLVWTGLVANANASPSAKLTYVRGVGAEKCPDEAALRRAVAARLGFDVFFPWARRTVLAEITKGPRGFRAKLQIISEDGVVLGVRSLDATSDNCADVAQALALAMSIAVDDFGLDEPPPPVAAPDPSPQAPSAPEPSAAAPLPPPPDDPSEPTSPPATRGPRYSIALTPTLSLGIAPSPSVGLRGAFDVRLARSFSLGIGVQGDLPASGGHVQTHALSGSLVPCLLLPRPLFFCAVLSAGDFHEIGVGVINAQPGDALFVSIAPRVGVALPIGSRFFALAEADAAFVVLRPNVQVSGMPAFQPHILSPSLAVGGGVDF